MSLPRWTGLTVLAALGLHAASKPLAALPDLLWGCHVWSFLIALGLLLRAPRLTSMGLLCHLAVGLPSWLLEAAAAGTTATSVLVHLLPPLLGFLDRRGQGLPRGTPWLAFACSALLQLVCRLATPPALNVNMVFTGWPPLQRVFPSQLVYLAATDLLYLALLLAVDLLLARWWGRPADREVALA